MPRPIGSLKEDPALLFHAVKRSEYQLTKVWMQLDAIDAETDRFTQDGTTCTGE